MSAAPDINAQTPIYDLQSPDFDILQAICTKLNKLPIQTDKTEPSCLWHKLDLRAKIYFLTDTPDLQ
jgi:hypothetical protein